MASFFIRDSTEADVPAITDIYAEAVLHGTGTFELLPPDAAEMARRRDAVLAARWPHLVAVSTDARTVAGFAYASTFRPRPAYAWTIEDSIYVAPTARGTGVGGALLRRLLERCEAAGARRAVAVIGDSANLGSIGLHASCGFTRAGTLTAMGWKFNRWLDVVLMERALGDGGTAPPVAEASTQPT